jgi:hypothetical protein
MGIPDLRIIPRDGPPPEEPSGSNGRAPAPVPGGGKARTPPRPKPKADVPELAREPDLVAAVRRDIAAVGLVGESDPALLVYLAYSSRKLNRPISVIVKGPSGSGKDEIQRRPADLMPPDDVLDLMSVTPQALYYGEPGWLSHKVLLGGERSHQDDDVQRDRTAAIRQMLSHGYITKQTVVEGKGRFVRQDGPVSYSETTTKDSVFREDANRCLQVNTDAGSKLTGHILAARAKAYLPGPDSTHDDRAKVRARHHEFQQSLAYVDVRIPFAKNLATKMPKGKIEVRRVFGHLLSLIEVIAYLHQHRRGRNEQGQLLATVEDYELARRLALGPLHAVIGLGADYAKFGPFVEKLPAREFDSNEAGKAMKTNSRKVTHDWLRKLAEMGVVRCVAEGSGNKPARWRKTGKSLDELILPTVASLRKGLEGGE